jgi:hypothetical protein
MSKKNNTSKVLKEIQKTLEQTQTTTQDPYLSMDSSDDEQILAEIEGKAGLVADKWVYVFMQGGKPIKGLSWIGTKNMVYYLRRKKQLNLSVEEITYEQDPTDKDFVLFRAKVRDLVSNAVSFGVKRQGVKMQLKDGSKVLDPFWYEKGFSKAKRNAFQDFLPTDVIAEWIDKWINEGKFEKLQGKQKERVLTLENKEMLNVKPFLQLIATAGQKEILDKLFVQISKKQDKLTAREMAYLKRAVEVRKKQLNGTTKKDN